MSDIDEMLSGEAPEAAETVQAEAPEQVETPEPEQTETPEPEKAETPEEPTVPLAVFKSMRDDLKAQIADRHQQQQPQQQAAPPPPPDVFEDPQGYQQYVQRQVQQTTTQHKLQMSKFFAEREFGVEAVQEVMEYFNAHPQQSQQFVHEASPFHAAKAYVDAQKTAQEVGADPAAYKAKLEAEIRAKLNAEMATKQAQAMASKAAPSLAGANGSGGNSSPGWQGPADLTSLIGE
jgi:hypothetical protein